MPMTTCFTTSAGARLAVSDGFTMILTLGVLMVTMLLSAAVFLAVQSDASLSRADLNGKRAYAAAQSGMQAYLYSLNVNASNSHWWETCANDTVGSAAGAVASRARRRAPRTPTPRCRPTATRRA